MIYLSLMLIGILPMTALFNSQSALAEESPDKAEQWRQAQIRFREHKKIQERMAKEGVSRELVEALQDNHSIDLGSIKVPLYARSYKKIAAEDFLKPGEHYRFELDDYIVTMVVPDAIVGSSWIVPYADTRTDPERDAALKKSSGGLEVANLAWYYGTGVWPLFIGWQGRMTLNIRYRSTQADKDADDYSTPEKLRERSSKGQKSRLPSQEQINYSASTKYLAETRIYLDTETTVINGRVWAREATNMISGRGYIYRTVLLPDRIFTISIHMPQYDYNANPDVSTYPAPLQRAFAQMEAMMASLRVAKQNDDGKPDPFVIERVEPAPWPIREKVAR